MKIPFVPSDFQILDFLEDVTFQNDIKLSCLENKTTTFYRMSLFSGLSEIWLRHFVLFWLSRLYEY